MSHAATISRTLASLLLCGSLAAPSFAVPPEGKGPKHKTEKSHSKGKQKGGNDERGGDTLVVVNLSATDARRIAYDNQAIGYASLPPGIRKNLARGKPLPPGIAKRGVPGPVLAQLPSYPGYEWQVAGSDLILVGLATAVIAEVLSGVFN